MNPLGFTAIFGTVLGLKIKCAKCGNVQNKKKYGLLVRRCEACGFEFYPDTDEDTNTKPCDTDL